jgi:hypothetical protein
MSGTPPAADPVTAWPEAIDTPAASCIRVLVTAQTLSQIDAETAARLAELVAGLDQLVLLIRDTRELPAEVLEFWVYVEQQMRSEPE